MKLRAVGETAISNAVKQWGDEEDSSCFILHFSPGKMADFL